VQEVALTVHTETAPPAAPPTDEELVRRVARGEVALFEVLLRRHDQRVYRTVRAILRDEDESEDAMQQAWLAAYLHLRDFEGTAPFATWIVRIAANEALQRLRRRVPRVAVPAGAEEERMDPHAEDPEERAAAHEAARLVERAVDRLPVHYRVVFVLREVEGLSTGETAAALGIREDAAKVRLHRARALLRRALEDVVDRGARDAFPFLAPRCNRVVAAVMAEIAGAQGPETA
jgi:RNA polymerase sigma-70 factor (ECF subfamily)